MNNIAALLILGLALGRAPQDPEDRPLTPEQRQQMIEQAARAEIQRQEIINLENEAARAIQLNNTTFFRRVYSDDFIRTLSHGHAVNKTSFIEAVQTPNVQYSSFGASDISVRTCQETAVVTCLWSARGIFKGQPFNSQID